MKLPSLGSVWQFLSGVIIVVCLLAIFDSGRSVHQSGERLLTTIEEKKSAKSDDIAKKLDVINKKLDEIMMKVK